MHVSGTVIEESLSDKSVLDGLKITGTRVAPVNEMSKTPWLKKWTLHRIEVPDLFAEIVAKKLQKALEKEHGWYADFKSDEVHFIIFGSKVFRIDRANKQEYEQASKYGLSLGIPAHQVDFAKNLKA